MSREEQVELAGLMAELVVAALDPSPWLDKQGIANHFACSARSIEKAMAEGMPYETIFGRPKFKIAACELWLREHGYWIDGDPPGILDGQVDAPAALATLRGRTPGGTPDAS